MIPSEQCGYEVLVDEVRMKFCRAPSDIKVSTHTFDTLFESYENSWETMVTLGKGETSAPKETSLLTSSHFLQRRTSSQGSKKNLKGVGTRERATL